MSGRLAAVTGASGFLGQRLVPALLADGWRVRCLMRRQPENEAAGVETVLGDLGDADALARLTEGAGVVVHAAGLIKARSRRDFFAVNAEGARRLAEATAGRMLLVSSLAAREPQLSDYAASKRAGEDAARAVLGERLTVLRPPAIYGPGDRETLTFFRLAQRGALLPLPGPPQGRVAIVHVDDAVAAILAQLAEPAAGVFAVGGHRPEGYAWREILAAAARAMGATPRLMQLPGWAVAAGGAVSGFAGRFAATPPIFTQGKAREFLHPDWSVSPTEQAPGAPPARYALEAGMADTVAWCRRVGWLT